MKTFREFLWEQLYSGVYMALKVQSPELVKYQKEHLSDYDIEEDLHCTLVYSDKQFVGDVQVKEYSLSVEPIGFNLFGPNNDVLVLELNDETLINRNKELVEKYGFVSDYDEYKPHITLAFEFTGDINKLPVITSKVQLSNEYIEEIK